ncbi:hypothetical protein MOQ72_25790 [Saccharopolyspora sp. K220]|uniref:hypothetical protein n=1 Tax=Saccharopolyspora soli TaxID=2926618 RepID=UPI001F587208|nr:hypothetical protein [Saccharopolyspora soli]MCI2420867.1 hypothetical protein [Saccharopolyspora soli]
MTATNDHRPFPFEQRCANVLDELRGTGEFDVSEARFAEIPRYLDDPDFVYGSLSEDYGLPLSPAVRGYFFRYDEIKAHWRSLNPNSDLVGEFRLSHIYSGRRMSYIWEGTNDQERELYQQLLIFDDTPQTGTGRMAMMRTPRGTTDPEIWYFDMHDGAMEMDLDYGAYLDTLLATKGTIGWQYLFCDKGMGDQGFDPIAQELKEMLEVFPRLFPDHDYSNLRARLRERV